MNSINLKRNAEWIFCSQYARTQMCRSREKAEPKKKLFFYTGTLHIIFIYHDGIKRFFSAYSRK